MNDVNSSFISDVNKPMTLARIIEKVSPIFGFDAIAARAQMAADADGKVH